MNGADAAVLAVVVAWLLWVVFTRGGKKSLVAGVIETFRDGLMVLTLTKVKKSKKSSKRRRRK